MKTLDITAKEWFDKVNGNSYFSAQIIIDYSLPTEQTIYLPFRYGYNDSYKTESLHELYKLSLLPESTGFKLNEYFKENNIVIRTTKHENQLKRDVKSFGIKPE